MSTRTLDEDRPWPQHVPARTDIINGDTSIYASGETVTAMNPATGARLADVAACVERCGRAVSARLVTREPRRKSSAMSWHFPLNIAAWKIAPALAEAKVVLKPDEASRGTALVLGQRAVEAGMPRGPQRGSKWHGREHEAGHRAPHVGSPVSLYGIDMVGKRRMSYAASQTQAGLARMRRKSANIGFADSEESRKRAATRLPGNTINQGEGVLGELELLSNAISKTSSPEPGDRARGRIRTGNPLDPASKLGAVFMGGGRSTPTG